MSSTSTSEEQAAASPPADAEHPDAFISYSHVDREFALRLRSALEEHGKTVWLDESEIHGGTRWSDELERAIGESDAFLFLLSPDSAASVECGKELELALRLSKRILPLRVRETPLDGAPQGLSAYQFIPARQPFEVDWDGALSQLLTEIEIDRDWVREHTDWSEKAREWERHQHDPSYLLSGAELEAAEQWRTRAASKQPSLSVLQSEFIDASRRASTRRLRRTRGFVSGALVVAIGLAVLAFVQRQQAVSESQIATSGELSAQSLLQLNSDPQLSLLLADRAAHTKQTSAALDALRRALPANHLLLTLQAPGDDHPIDSAQWSPAGSEVLTDSEDGHVRLWNARTGALMHSFSTEAGVGQTASFDRAGDEIVAGWAGRVQVWSLGSPSAPLATIADPTLGQLEAAELSPDGKLLATASGPGIEGSYTLWDAHTGQKLHVLENATAGTGNMGGDIVFSPNGRLVATGSENGIAAVWDARSGRLLRVFDVSRGASSGLEQVLRVAFDPSGRLLLASAGFPSGDGLSVSSSQMTEVWSIAGGRRIAQVNGADGAWSPDGRYISTTSSDGTARVWSASTGQLVSQMKPEWAITGQPQFAPDVYDAGTGRPDLLSNLLTGSNQGPAAVWNATSGVGLATLAGDTGPVTAEGFSPDGTRVLTASTDGAARIWDTGVISGVTQPQVPALRSSDAVELQPLDGYIGVSLRSPLRAVKVAASQAVGAPATLAVIDARTQAVLSRLANAAGFSSAAFDQAGRLMLLARSDPQSGTPLAAQLRLTHGGGVVHALGGPEGRAEGGLLSPDGQLAATIDHRHAITVWNARTGHRLVTFTRHVHHPDQYHQVQVTFRFSPDGQLLLSSDDTGWTYVWRARTGQVLNAIHGPAAPPAQISSWGGAISPDDSFVVTTASWDATAHVYRVGRRAQLLALRGGQVGIEDVAFSPAGSLLATISDNGPDDGIRLWDTSEPTAIDTIAGSFGNAIAFSSDGLSLLTYSYDSDGREQVPCVVCGGFSRLLTLAHHKEIRGFTSEERQLYLGS